MVRRSHHNVTFAHPVGIEVQSSSGALILTPRKSQLQQNFIWEMSRKYILAEKRLDFVATGVDVKNITLNFYFSPYFKLAGPSGRAV
jgi:hypothetical protein